MPQNTRTTLRSLKSKIKSRRKTLVIHSKAPALDVYERMEFNGQIQALRWAEKTIDNMLREAKEGVMNIGIIKAIEEVSNYGVGNQTPMSGSHSARLGLSGMLNSLSGGMHMDGYRVVTDKHEYLVLIDNSQSCCESFGYFSTDDNLPEYIGKELLAVELTDTSLKTEPIEEIKYLDEGGIQFVTFKTSGGDFQLAVYNAHNGYYGHGIIVAEDNKILLQDTL